jgi:hypothetical protein
MFIRPALLISTSNSPACRAKVRTEDRSARFSAATRTSPSMPSATRCALAVSRQAMITVPPLRASMLVVCLPMPPFAPVITKVRPV